jgi:hypothetical protein
LFVCLSLGATTSNTHAGFEASTPHSTPERCTERQNEQTPARCACFENVALQYDFCKKTTGKLCESKREQAEVKCRKVNK